MSDAEPAFTFVVAGEDESHLEACRAIMRRVLEQAIPWMHGLLDDGCWQLCRISKAVEKYKKLFPKRFGSALHGFGSGMDGRAVKAQVRLWADEGWQFDAGVIARDTDHETGRRASAEDALRPFSLPKPIVLAYPEPEVEACFIAGFTPDDDDEATRMAELGLAVAGSGRLASRLTSTKPGAKTDAKWILDHLTNGEPLRVARCLERDLDTWKVCAEGTGLSEFVDACEQEIVAAMTRKSKP